MTSRRSTTRRVPELSVKGENGKSGLVRTEPDPPPQEVSPISLSVEVADIEELGVNAAVSVSVEGLHDDDDQEGQPDYTYRIDIVDENGDDADACEGVGMNEKKRLFATYFDWFLLAAGPYELDAETSELGADAGCAYASSYTVNASISDDEGTVLATASTTFEVLIVQYSHAGNAPTLTGFGVAGLHQVTGAVMGPYFSNLSTASTASGSTLTVDIPPCMSHNIQLSLLDIHRRLLRAVQAPKRF